VAAHSTTRALYGAYNGSLYQVRRASDNATRDIGVLSPGGVANAAAQDSFCAGTSCVITIIYDQSGRNNRLTQAPPGGFNGPAAGGFDNLANATAAPTTVLGQKAYGVFIAPGTGYRNNATNGIATGDQAEGMYAVFDGTHFNGGCCFDYGNAETNSRDDGNGTMEAIYFGNITVWGFGSGNGPWIMADLENGLFSGFNTRLNSNDPSVNFRYLTAIIKGQPNNWAIRGGNAQSGGLSTFYNGVRPNASGYNPMKKQGAIILGIGGDNSVGAAGTFYEGVMTSGFPSDATENSVQANITAAGYGNTGGGGVAGSARAIVNVNANHCLDDFNANKANNADVDLWPCTGQAPQQWDVNAVGDGSFTVINRNSGTCLDDFNLSTTPGARVDLWPCNGGAWQHWLFQQQSNGTYAIVNQYANLCLDDFNFDTSNGALVKLYTCNGLTVQQYHF
jgi:hypothetical protein